MGLKLPLIAKASTGRIFKIAAFNRSANPPLRCKMRPKMPCFHAVYYRHIKRLDYVS